MHERPIFGGSFECDCADVAPTMPTCRGEHLADCPVFVWQKLHDPAAMQAAMDDPEAAMREAARARAAARMLRLRSNHDDGLPVRGVSDARSS